MQCPCFASLHVSRMQCPMSKMSISRNSVYPRCSLIISQVHPRYDQRVLLHITGSLHPRYV
ncbi:hypothetical protein AHAS_Ahas19G0326900 [Arachis hypogaea]